MRFTIRDLLWLTVVVALGTGWALEHRHFAGLQQELSGARYWIASRTQAIEKLQRDLRPYGLTLSEGIHSGPKLEKLDEPPTGSISEGE